MDWPVNNPNDIWKYKEHIVKTVKIVDIMAEAGVKLERIYNNQFSHKLRCPFHNNGKEKTPSMYVSENTNSYFCFACGAGSNVLDFVSQLNGTPAVLVLESLAKRIGLIDTDGSLVDLKFDVQSEPKEHIEPYLFKISELIRTYIKTHYNSNNFEKELRWIEKVAARVDHLVSQID